ncbi:MAG: hypothetical protein JF564_08535 [Sphingomonas sp.]|nr:hypothetical protein [Sphingomonas sp.]
MRSFTMQISQWAVDLRTSLRPFRTGRTQLAHNGFGGLVEVGPARLIEAGDLQVDLSVPQA